jgi:hypothetical protein
VEEGLGAAKALWPSPLIGAWAFPYQDRRKTRRECGGKRLEGEGRDQVGGSTDPPVTLGPQDRLNAASISAGKHGIDELVGGQSP